MAVDIVMWQPTQAAYPSGVDLMAARARMLRFSTAFYPGGGHGQGWPGTWRC